MRHRAVSCMCWHYMSSANPSPRCADNASMRVDFMFNQRSQMSTSGMHYRTHPHLQSINIIQSIHISGVAVLQLATYIMVIYPVRLHRSQHMCCPNSNNCGCVKQPNTCHAMFVSALAQSCGSEAILGVLPLAV